MFGCWLMQDCRRMRAASRRICYLQRHRPEEMFACVCWWFLPSATGSTPDRLSLDILLELQGRLLRPPGCFRTSLPIHEATDPRRILQLNTCPAVEAGQDGTLQAVQHYAMKSPQAATARLLTKPSRRSLPTSYNLPSKVLSPVKAVWIRMRRPTCPSIALLW